MFRKKEEEIDIGIGETENGNGETVVSLNSKFEDELKGDSSADVDGEVDYGTYPADCYSFMSIHGPFDGNIYFYFGFLIWVFQVSFLMLMVLHVIHPKLSTNENDDNPDNGFWSNFVPANAGGLPKFTQFMALTTYCVFADESLKDIITAVETFPMFSKAKPGDRVKLMVLSNLLRLSQGLLATFVVFLLVVTTNNVVDIVLNFTAVNFISAFDDVAFELAQWGKYGPKLKVEADRIEELPAPACIFRKYQHVRYRYTVLPVALILLVCLLIVTLSQRSSNVWLTQSLRIQFKDDPLRNDYNGCYRESQTMPRYDRRVFFESFEKNAKPSQIGYCQGSRKWYLFTGNETDPCRIEEEDKVAMSSKTYTFDFSSITEETWYSRTGSPLELYFFDDNLNDLDDGLCGSFLGDGNCDPFFNIFDHNYDEGDCCVASCDGLNCGRGTMTKVFNRNVTAGNGYPLCDDPDMKPITIELHNVYVPVNPFAEEDNISPFDNLPPRDPLMVLDCDGKNVLAVNIRSDMKFETETVHVADGADCLITIKNNTGGLVDIQFVNYTVYHGDEEDIETNPIVMFHADSATEGIRSFQRIPECFFKKLKNHVDITTIYTGEEPSNKAIKWLMEDSTGFSNCQFATFIERYALATFNYAAPLVDPDSTDLWISTQRQCVWPTISCVDGKVAEIDLGYASGLVVSGTIPTELGLLPNASWMDFSSNELSGSIPTEIGEWQSLEFFGVDENSITGTIPTEIQQMPNLQWLIFNSNKITGTIPSELGNTSSLTGIVAVGNELTGTIPKEISEATLLEFLIIGVNALTGTIPTELGLLSNLTWIESTANLLTGTIPTELAKLPNLQQLQIGYNALTGPIPPELLNKTFVSFDVYGNSLSDLIPVDGSEVCEAGGGEIYCNCNSDCTFSPQSCSCEKAISCCSSFLDQYTPCFICPNGLGNPDTFNEDYLATCRDMSDYITNDLLQFGTDEGCEGAKMFFGAIGCFCSDG